MLVRTDIRTPFGGKPRLLPDVLGRKAVLRRRSAMMANQVSRLVEMSKQRAAELDAMVGGDGAGGEKRPAPVISWFAGIDWRNHLELLAYVANTVAAGLGYILLALTAIVWLFRP